MKKKKQKKGISLIVLIITIIIMIILAATIIISLSNNGIIDKANEAVDKTNEKQVEELASLAWTTAYMDGARTKDELEKAVEDALDKSGINKDDYNIIVTTSGVTIAKGWIQKDNRTVVKGNTVLNIGDYVNYVSGVEGYTDTNGWQVLGAENGELLLLSAEFVTDKSYAGSVEDAKYANENGVRELNEICAPYGKGKNALGARSITAEDIDRVTGYDKTTYDKGEIGEYGNTVTYSYNGTNKPAYSCSNEVPDGTLSRAHSNGFHWYDENGNYHYVSASDLIDETNNGKELAKIKSTYYTYDASIEIDLKEKAPNAYTMLFGQYEGYTYWLATLYAHVYSYDVSFGLLCNGYYGGVTAAGELSSDGDYYYSNTHGIRAVVRISHDANCTGSSLSGWDII